MIDAGEKLTWEQSLSYVTQSDSNVSRCTQTFRSTMYRMNTSETSFTANYITIKHSDLSTDRDKPTSSKQQQHTLSIMSTPRTGVSARRDWIEQCFTFPPTQYRLYGRRFLQVKRPNQQYQSTEGTNSTQTNQTYTVGHKKTRHFYFFDNSDKYWPIFVIFSLLYTKWIKE